MSVPIRSNAYFHKRLLSVKSDLASIHLEQDTLLGAHPNGSAEIFRKYGKQIGDLLLEQRDVCEGFYTALIREGRALEMAGMDPEEQADEILELFELVNGKPKVDEVVDMFKEMELEGKKIAEGGTDEVGRKLGQMKLEK